MKSKYNDAPPLVVHIIYALGTGGLENGLVNIINRTPPDRYRHAIVCLTTADSFATRITAAGVRVIALNKRPGHDLGVYWRLWKVLRELRPSIVHTRNLAALEMQLVAVAVAGSKRIHGEHGRDIYDIDGSNRKYRLMRRLLRPLIHHFIAVSADLHGWLRQQIGVAETRVSHVYNGVDQEKFSPRRGARPDLAPEGFLPPETVVIGTVGRLAEVKDQRLLIEAFALLLNENPSFRSRVRLVLIGDGPLYARLKQQAADLGIGDLTWMPGDQDEVAGFLRMFDIFILPSLAEGISNTILEAMASGLPVVATDVGGNPELVEQNINGYLVPSGDVGELANRLRDLIEDPSLREEMGSRGYSKVGQQFNWDRTVNNYLSIYDEVLSAG